jgi:RNA polymerase sigma-70 factor, ECF subfamily
MGAEPEVAWQATRTITHAFAAWCCPTSAMLMRLRGWIVGNPTDAEDVVQDACLRAFRGIKGYAGGNARAGRPRFVSGLAAARDARTHSALSASRNKARPSPLSLLVRGARKC